MNLVETYVAFWPPSPSTFWSRFGHVECFGYTVDNTWVFIDPRQHGLDITVTHHWDDVMHQQAYRFANCEVWRVEGRGELTFPLLGMFNCVGVVASVLGLRAYTFRGLRRRLRAIGAERLEVLDVEAEGRSGGQDCEDARAPDFASGAGPGGAQDGLQPGE